MLVVILGLFATFVLLVPSLARETRELSPTLGDIGLWLTGDDEPLSADARARRFTVQRGDTAAAIAERLEQERFISSALAFRLRARSEGLDVRFEAGDYDLAPSMRPSEIMLALQHGRIAGSALTIPEGWRIGQIADAVEARRPGSRAELVHLATVGRFDFSFLADRPSEATLEGYLFPDTYQLGPETTNQRLIETMLTTFGQKVGPDRQGRARARGLSMHQVVTLASIVEREARVASERPMMASVYLNRLRQNMLLQADPTVQFALRPTSPAPAAGAQWWKTDLTGTDLRNESPYNTYVRRGLPPGPICSPGLASIDAVLDAGPTDFLYFVAKADGSHLFATSLAEHNANVAKVNGR